MATRDEIKKIIAYMALAFQTFHPDVTSEPNTVDVYEDLLGDMPFDVLWLAMRAACVPGTSKQFAPSPDEIRGMVTSLHIKATGVPQAGEAWQEVMRVINETGCHNGTPEFSHPLIKKAVQAIGFVNIGMSEDVMIERAHFLKIYSAYLERATEDAAMLPQAVEYIEARKQIGADIRMLTDKLSVAK